MRVMLVVVVMLFVVAAGAQSVIQNRRAPDIYGSRFTRVPVYDSSHPGKWSFSKYVSLSTGFSFFKGGSASFVAAPAGLQLNRRLNNNLYAFAGVSAAPLYLNFNGAWLPTDITQTSGNPFMKTGSLGMYSKAELGLMYINDAKTFSISGSLGVERSSAPVFYPNPVLPKQRW